MRHKRFSQYFILSFLIAAVSLSGITVAQNKEEIKQQAEAQLNTMTPEQIDAKIKDVGLTRGEAEAKAKELGIDLDAYLKGYSPTKPATTTPSLQQPVTTTGTQKKEAAAVTKVIEQPVIKKMPFTTDVDLQLFGQAFFKSGVANFEPSPSFSEKEYVVGTGDVLKISLWGTTEMTNEFTVDKDGRIIVPTVGPILLAGFTFEEAKKKIQLSMSKSYSGLVETPPKIFMDVSLSKLRPIRVIMMGEVEQPGGYFVNNFASVFNSLFVVGGPKASGTMRDIRVIRSNRVVTKVDLYDYLIGNSRTNDIRINENDIIFVPLRGTTVTIKGQVLRPGKFELLSNENLKKLIEFSGGLKSDVYKERIQVDRIIPMNERIRGGPERKVFDVDFSDIAKGTKDYSLEDGDIVTIFPILDTRTNIVAITGAVFRPGIYQIEKLNTIRDLITAADGLLKVAYLKRAELVRTYPNFKQELFVLDIEKVMSGEPSQNLKLQSRDNLRIYTLDEILGGPNTVTMEGQAKNPGISPLYLNLTLYEFIQQNVGLSDTLFRKSIFLDRADLIRKLEDGRSTRIVQFNLWDLYNNKTGDTLLLPGDRIIIYPKEAVQLFDESVEIYGKVKKPAVYPLAKDMSLVDLLLLAGGYTEDGWAVQAEVTRVGEKELWEDSLIHVIFTGLPDLFDTTKAKIDIINSSTAKKFLLRNRDKVFIRPNPEFYQPRGVTVTGQAKFPGTYMLSMRNERLTDLLARAGGISRDGYARGTRIIREGVPLRLNAEDAFDDPGGKDDIILQTGDQVNVPFKPNTVVVNGEVNNAGIYGYVDGENSKFYINRAGGLKDSADFILVSYPEGYVMRANIGWLSSSPTIPDGSSIFVTKIVPPPPPPPETGTKTSFYDMTKDILALTATTVTILVLVQQLNK